MQVTFTYRPLCNMLSNQFAAYISQKICELNDVFQWPRECPGNLMSSDGKSNRVLSRPKLWTKTRVLGPIRFFVDRLNSSKREA